MRLGVSLPTPASFRSPLHNERTAAHLGIALGVTFGICFLTGLLSHVIQTPQSWPEWPAAPRDLYRVITATHVVTGFATIPILAAKLWTVYPKLWSRPLFASPAHAVERLSLIPLVGGSLFLVVGGVDDSMYIYVNPVTFTPTHYLMSWITVGALVIHIVAKRAATLDSLRRLPGVAAMTPPAQPATPDPTPPEPPAQAPVDGRPAAGAPAGSAPEPEPDGPRPDAATEPADGDDDGDGAERRRFLITVGAAAGIVGINYLAANVSPIHRLALLSSRRADVGVQRLPVQTQAKAAGVVERVTGPDYRLRVVGNVPNPLELDVEDLLQRVSHTAYLPISCVQGWSVGATWRGVRLRDLLREAGVTDFDDVVVTSVQITTKPMRMFGRARINRSHALHPDSMLATELNGERLHIDHGYPVRFIAPNRPGIMCTKWVEELRVR